MLRDTAASKSSTNYVYDFGGKNLEKPSPVSSALYASHLGDDALLPRFSNLFDDVVVNRVHRRQSNACDV